MEMLSQTRLKKFRVGGGLLTVYAVQDDARGEA
jgi:hypothetical protein